jgi:hypothetical protein
MELTLEDKIRFWKKVDIKEENECWNWIGCLYYKKEGYGGITINKKPERSHRVALFIIKGPPPTDKPCVLHSCKQNRLCCNPNHLRYGTHKENMIDRKNDGTTYIVKGSNHQNSKLTEEQLREIRQKYIPYKYSMTKLAIEYNVCSETIRRLINGITYKEQ